MYYLVLKKALQKDHVDWIGLDHVRCARRLSTALVLGISGAFRRHRTIKRKRESVLATLSNDDHPSSFLVALTPSTERFSCLPIQRLHTFS